MNYKKIGIMATTGLTAVGSALATYTGNYTPTDMPNIATDVIGEGGVQLKTYVPLIILLAIVAWGAKVIYGLRRRG